MVLPATSMMMPRGFADPSFMVPISGPMTVTCPSLISFWHAHPEQISKAGDLPPPNSTYISSLRMLFPWKDRGTAHGDRDCGDI